jgi:hypothetical protein
VGLKKGMRKKADAFMKKDDDGHVHPSMAAQGIQLVVRE